MRRIQGSAIGFRVAAVVGLALVGVPRASAEGAGSDRAARFTRQLDRVEAAVEPYVFELSTRAGLDEFRRQVRLLTPAALTAARAALVDWKSSDPRPSAKGPAEEIYSQGEAAARLKAVEAAQVAWKHAYGRAKVRIARLVAKAESEAESQRFALEAKEKLRIMKEDRAGLLDRAGKKSALAIEAVRKLAAERVAEMLARQVEEARREIEATELARADREGDEAGFHVYRREEEAAYLEASEWALDPESEESDESDPGTTGTVVAGAPEVKVLPPPVAAPVAPEPRPLPISPRVEGPVQPVRPVVEVLVEIDRGRLRPRGPSASVDASLYGM